MFKGFDIAACQTWFTMLMIGAFVGGLFATLFILMEVFSNKKAES